MNKLTSIFKNLYALLLVIIIVSAIYLCSFLRTYLYNTIYNSQIISIFRKHIPMPNTAEFEKIEANLAKKLERTEIKWEKIRDPFGESVETASSTEESGQNF